MKTRRAQPRDARPAEPVSKRVLRTLLRVGEGAGLALVFAGGSVLALLSYANLPASKRLLAGTLQRALSGTFYGNFTVSAVEHVSLTELHLSGLTVRDPDGHIVLTVNALHAEANLIGLGRQLLLGKGTVTLRIDHARLERAEVYLLSSHGSNVPTIVDAFTPVPGPKSSTPAPPATRQIKVWLPEIEAGRIYGRIALGTVPTLETELSNVHGAVLGTSELTSVDVERFSVLARGIGGVDARGVGSVHVRAPGAVWTSFDGYFGDVQLGTVVRVDAPKLDITVDVPRVEPAAARALWQAYPLQTDMGAHVEAVGPADSLHTQGRILVGRGSIDATGELRLSGDLGADLDLSGRALDLRAVWPALPETQIDTEATLSIFKSDGAMIADVNGSTHPTSVAGTAVPAMDVNGAYTAKGFDAHATVHEPGMPLKVAVTVHPDGAVDASAEAKHVDLSRAPRLQPYFKGRGSADVQVKAHIEKNKLDARVDADVQKFQLGALSFERSKISGRASGPLNSPRNLALDFTATSQMLRAGPLGFDEVETKARGPILRPLVSATVNNQYGPSISGSATVSLQAAPRLDDLRLAIQRDQAALNAKVKQVAIDGDNVRVDGLSLQGAGGQLEASGQLGPERLSLVAQGSELDLGIITHALGLPRGALGGKVALDADFDSSKKAQRGSLLVKLGQGQIDGAVVDSASFAAQLVDSHLDLQTSAKFRDFGNFVAEARSTVKGSLGDIATLEHATGTLTVTGSHLPLGLVGYVLPKSVGVDEVRGEGTATLVLSRQEPKAIPSASLLVNTSGLFVSLAAKKAGDPARSVSGVDAHVGLNVNGDTGQTDLTLKLEDRHGQLISATTNLTVNLEAAAREPEKLLTQLSNTKLVAKAVIEDRALEDLPAVIAPKGIAGRLRTEASLRGTFENPVFSDKTELSQLRFGGSERDKAIDVCAQIDYDKSSGQYGARGELFLPSAASRACKGTRVAQFSGAGRAEWARLMNPGLNADPAWTGTAGLSLEGMPLDVIPALAEAGFEGKVLGAVMFDRRQALPQMFAQLEVRNAVMARTQLGTANVQARTDGRTLTAKVTVTERAGKLDGDLQTSMNWQGVVPGIDDTRPITAHINASSADAVILSPFVSDVLSEVGGKLDSQLTINLTPNLDPSAEQHWTGAVSGSVGMRDGTLQLARLALRMRNVKFTARAEAHANSTLISIDSLSAAAEAERVNVAARGNIWLQGFRLSKGNARATLRGVPFLIEGVTVATLDGNDMAADLERLPTEMFLTLTVPRLSAVLPKSGTRSLVSLSDDADIVVGQPITQPRKGGDNASLPWRIRFDLGNNVHLTRTDLFLPVTGSPEILLGEQLKARGSVELLPGGRLSLPGLPRPFTIENGLVSFDPDGDPADPRIAVQAICETQQVTVRAKVSGTLSNAKIDTLEDLDDPSVTDRSIILAKLLNTPTDDTSANTGGNPAAAGLGAGAGLIGSRLLANTALSNLQIKAGSETTADQHLYQTYSAAYPLTDTLWFEGSYKTLQGADLTGATANAFSGTFDWRFRRNWSLRTEIGNIGAGMDLLWQYRY